MKINRKGITVDIDELDFRKSSFSNQSGCVEVAEHNGHWVVRDSKKNAWRPCQAFLLLQVGEKRVACGSHVEIYFKLPLLRPSGGPFLRRTRVVASNHSRSRRR